MSTRVFMLGKLIAWVNFVSTLLWHPTYGQGCRWALKKISATESYARVFEDTKVTGRRSKVLSAEEIEAVEIPARMVWARYMSSPREIQIEVHDRLILNGKPFTASAAYVVDTDSIVVDLENLKDLAEKAGSLEMALWLVIPHEAKHMVQHHSGEQLQTSLDHNNDLLPHYCRDELEADAWHEAMDVFRARFPDKGKSVKIYGQFFSFPTESSYPQPRGWRDI